MIATVPRLIELIRDSRVLDAGQDQQLAGSLQPRFTEPRLLGEELVRRGWLTDLQLRWVTTGRGQDLTLGPYLILDRVGNGTMGEVFKARRRRDGRLVALKAIRPDRRHDVQVLARFRREVLAMAKLAHPNVISACDVAEIGVAHYYAMEYVEGVNLDRLIARRGALPVAAACDYVRQAALGLQHAHEQGLIHRDVKPGNLLVIAPGTANGHAAVPRGMSAEARARFGRWGTIKLLDLGLVLLKETSTNDDAPAAMTQEGWSLGTVDYMAPEQVSNPHGVDIRADLYSLGCSFYEMLTGRLPFPDGSPVEKLTYHRQREPVPVPQLRPEVPVSVVGVVQKLMAKKAGDRYARPGEVSAALAGILMRLPPAAVDWNWKPPAKVDDAPPPSMGGQPDDAATSSWSTHHVLAAVGVVLVTLIILLVVWR